MLKKLILVGLIPCLSLGCDLLDAATSDRPDGTQRNAIGDMFGSIGAFISVVDDPASASDGDFADMHATQPVRDVLDPDGAATARSLEPSRVGPEGCAVAEGGTASWDCDFIVAGNTCHATGSGQQNADGTYSGSSTQTCGTVVTTITATNLQFDEVSGTGGGTLVIGVGDPAASDFATINLDNVGFCTDEESVAPNSGTMTIDGFGPLEGTPFDPLTLEFTDSPECGVVLIR